MCSDCRKQTLDRKIAQFEEPRACPRGRGTRKLNEKTASRKVLLDRLKAAKADLLTAIERRETHGKDSWLASGIEWYEKRYEKAAENCRKAGVGLQ